MSVRVMNIPIYKYIIHARHSLSFSQAMDEWESVSWIEEPPKCHDQGTHTHK